MVEWAAGVYREAGSNPEEHMDEVRFMANEASDGVVRQGLKAVATETNAYDLVHYLEGIELDGLLYRVDEVYATAIDMAVNGRPGPRNPVQRAVLSEFDRKLDQVFTELRPAYIDATRRGNFDARARSPS